jgi:hypothetical protein
MTMNENPLSGAKTETTANDLGVETATKMILSALPGIGIKAVVAAEVKREGKSMLTAYVHIRILTFYRRKRDRSEERRTRKAEKRKIREEEEARHAAELSVYSASDNPFHDVNLDQQFRWHKKQEKEKKAGMSLLDSQRRDALRRQEAKEELDRLNKRRADREAEMRLREEEELKMQRLQESAQMAEWLAKEGDFQLEQERHRAVVRIREKRAKAIDFLALNLKYLNPEDNEGDVEDETVELEIDLDEPYNIFNVSHVIILSIKCVNWRCRTCPASKQWNYTMI